MEGSRIAVFVQPHHLASLTEFADMFGRSPNTIRRWHNEGATIAFLDGRYSAEYNTLQAWCVESGRASGA